MASSDVEVSIEHTVKFLLDCKGKGREFDNRRVTSIFTVPSTYRDLSPRSFNPRLVSIGPLHRRDKKLQGFEVQKMSYFHRLLDLISSNPEKILQECVQKVSMKIERIKACYVESTTYDDEELARMMVIDACFILYFCHLLNALVDGQYPDNFLILNGILYDLVLIENQIPFFVLEDIFESTILQKSPSATLTKYMKDTIVSSGLVTDNILEHNLRHVTHQDHILGLLHKCLHPTANNITSRPYGDPKRHSAMELDRAGVHFRPNEDVNWPMAMKLELPRYKCFPWFWCKPTLRMPKVIIHDDTEMILRNLIMYEQFYTDRVPNYVTSYAFAMDSLIDKPEDVAKLVKSGVLVNECGSNEEAANMINNICKEIAAIAEFYHQELEDLDAYYNSYWPNLAAELKRTYFSNPWSVIALFAAIVLFVITVLQTIFQIKDMYVP